MHSDDTGSQLLRLARIARGLVDDGQYNVAMLVRAAALGLATHAAEERPRIGGGLEEELAAAIAALDPTIVGEELIARLRSAAGAVAAGRYPTLSEVSQAWVCRLCGRVLLGDEPGDCPRCGGRALTHERVPAIFYTDPLPVPALLATLERQGRELEAMAAGMRAEEAARGVWPAREIVTHLLASDEVFMGRVERVLAAEGEPELDAIEPDAMGAGEAAPRLAALLDRFEGQRARTLARLRALDEREWARAGQHPEFGRMTVRDLVTYLARHEALHLPELEARRRGD